MNELILLHSGREVIYTCLSKIFLDIPGNGFYEMLETFINATALMTDAEGLSENVEKLSAFLETRKKLSEQELALVDMDIARAYTTLYCLSNSVPVSESVYTSPSGLAMQESAGQVWRMYKQYAFDMNHHSNEASDHISYELMFMAYLAKRTARLISEGNFEKARMLVTAQKAFLNQHLQKWAGSFAEATRLHPTADTLYAPAARFMAEYIKEDESLLKYLANLPEFAAPKEKC